MAKSPYKFPKNKISTSDFVEFCHLRLGVSPGRVIADIQTWLSEDQGAGDATLFSSFTKDAQSEMYIIAKESFVICGIMLMAEVFWTTSPEVEIFSDFKDGDVISKGDVVIAGRGSAAGFLLGERVALNLSSRLSGISQKTQQMVKALKKFSKKTPELLETRKTTPGLRIYEKYATRTGGARNHRHGLDSGVMFKENHLRTVGGIQKALAQAKKNAPILTRIEVEVTSLAEFSEAMLHGADVIMLDNFSLDDVKKAVAMLKKSKMNPKLELSGNLDNKDLAQLANLEIDYMSMGALIHKANWVDMSLQLYPKNKI